jgi:hypothetical protein
VLLLQHARPRPEWKGEREPVDRPVLARAFFAVTPALGLASMAMRELD